MPESEELSGWKAIAGHLGMSVRAAQEYEKSQGLPVNRLPGNKGPVFADAQALTEWKKQPRAEKTPVAQPPPPIETTPLPKTGGRPFAEFRSPKWAAVILAGVLFFGFAAWAGYRVIVPLRQPAKVEIEGGTLISLDIEGKELWRHQFQTKIPFSSTDSVAMSRHTAVADIDGDANNETLLDFGGNNAPEINSSTLHCFSSRGQERWTFTPGATRTVIADTTERLLPPYFINNILVLKWPGKNPLVAVSSNHYMSHPDQVAILNGDGRLVGEYWHSGHLIRVAKAQLKHDGRELLLVAGVDNGEHRAVLLVFDPTNVDGAPRYKGANPFQLQGMEPGTEKATVLFPRSCMSTRHPFNIVSELNVTPNRIIVGVSESNNPDDVERILYQFNYNLEPVGITPLPEFFAAHRDRRQMGKLDHSWTDKEGEQLLNGVVIQRRH